MRDGQPMIASKLGLSPCAVSVLGQLFVEGPTSDDNITSRAGRCDLVSAGLAFHEAGLSSLTPDGVRLAREWDQCSLYARLDRRQRTERVLKVFATAELADIPFDALIVIGPCAYVRGPTIPAGPPCKFESSFASCSSP